MWVFCSGMKRSGSTLQYQLVAHIVEAAGRGGRVGWTETFEAAASSAEAETISGWKVYKNHNYSDSMGVLLGRGEAKGVYVYRDLRDVFVSFMHKQNAPFERLWGRDILAELVENYDLWTRQPNMLVTRYETMMADLRDEIVRIAAHLGLTLSDDEAAAVADEYRVDKQLERISTATELMHHPGIKRVGVDKHSLLHENHISEEQGQVDQWKTALTPDEIGLIEAKYGGWLLARGYALSVPPPLNNRMKVTLQRLLRRA